MNIKSEKTKRAAATIAVAVLLLSGITYFKAALTDIRGKTPPLESMTFLPGSERIKPFMLGFNTTYAHYLWIRTGIYTGEHYLGDQKYDWLTPMVDMITRLHPHFNEAYEFAGLLIPDYTGDSDAAKVILERGINVFGTKRWNIPFYLGMLYYRYYGDNERAAQSVAMAAQAQSNHRARLTRLAATFFNRAERDEDALEILMFMYESSENPDVRKHIEAKIEELFSGGSSDNDSDNNGKL